MTDAHTHVIRGEERCFLCDPTQPGTVPRPGDAVFHGTHPWHLDGFDEAALRARLLADPKAGVGEIGLDRLKDRTISPQMREVFVRQLKLAGEFRRPVVLHGAKCWGEVVRTIRETFFGQPLPPAFLFHGFSRSGGLLPDILSLNGFVSVGPALLNDHAVNYRALVKALPLERLLVESDATADTAADTPPLSAIVESLAVLRGMGLDALLPRLDANAAAFLRA